MPRRKEAIRYASRGEKELWHPYGLQGLSTERFATVVNRILCGRFMLLHLNTPPLVSRQSEAQAGV
jgi:hypothetical protein